MTAADRGARLDQLLARKLPQLSRSRIQVLIEQGAVVVSTGAPFAALRLRGGELIEVHLPPTADAQALEPEALPIARVFEDEHLVVLDKAAGMVVHPGAGHARGTLANALLHHLRDLQGIGGTRRPGLVHRLDKDTSGLIVVAKHEGALKALQAAFRTRQVEKIYLALVAGHPPERGTFRTLYGRHPRHRVRFSSRVKEGKLAVTHFKVTARFARASRVEVSLETGRTHQIRVHFADAGHPLLGDKLYGTSASRQLDVIERQALHAFRLGFRHPVTQAELSFTAPLPPDLVRAQRRLAAEEALARRTQ